MKDLGDVPDNVGPGAEVRTCRPWTEALASPDRAADPDRVGRADAPLGASADRRRRRRCRHALKRSGGPAAVTQRGNPG